jgi:hypothetical protein
MSRTHTFLGIFYAVAALAPAFPAAGFAASTHETPAGPPPVSALWTERPDLSALDLINGAGGKEHQPAGKFKFVKEDKEGTSPKFEVVDEQGVKWKAKLGEESKAEIAATRLVWAVGYYTDEDYYVAQLPVENMTKLSRGRQFVSDDGVALGVRLERKLGGQKKTGNWSWFKNPFTGTRELNGLRVMMALINNWDLKEINNAVYGEKKGEVRYVVSDLGASFGATGNSITRSKSDPGEYNATPFVQKVSSRPFVLSVFNLPNYATRTHMQDVAKDIPIADARWIGKLLGALSEEQIRDCFRGAGYSVGEVEEYARTVEDRVKALNTL